MIVLTIQVVRIKVGRSAYKILIGKPPRNILLGRPRRKLEDHIRMDLKENRYQQEELGYFGSG